MCSMLQLQVLRFVAEAEHVTMTNLARVFGIRSSSATVMVDRLAKAKLLQRRVNTQDGRVVYLQITPKGKRSLAVGQRYVVQQMRSILAHLNANERQAFSSIMKKISHAYATS